MAAYTGVVGEFIGDDKVRQLFEGVGVVRGLIIEIPIFPIILTTNFRFGQDDRLIQGREKSIIVARHDTNTAGFTHKSLCCL